MMEVSSLVNMKQMLFLAVFQAVRLRDNEWAKLYDQLVKPKVPL
jgi:hypothetical protein